MRHLKALGLKFIMLTAVLEVVLGLMTNLSFGNILIVSFTLTILAYIIGDLIILNNMNNTIATASDLILSFAIIFFFPYILELKIGFFPALVSSILIGVGEWFYHKYVDLKVFREEYEKKHKGK